MLDSIHSHRTRAAAALVVALAVFPAACDDDPSGPADPAEEVHQVSLLIGGSTTIVINEAGTITPTGAMIEVPLGGSRTVVATWQRANGTAVTGLEAEFELRIVPATAGVVTFTRTTTFAGTLTAVAAGTTNVEVQLFHLGEGHADFAQTIPLRVQ